MKARTTIRDIDPQNDLTFLRVRSKKNEIMIAPGEVGEAKGQVEQVRVSPQSSRPKSSSLNHTLIFCRGWGNWSNISNWREEFGIIVWSDVLVLLKTVSCYQLLRHIQDFCQEETEDIVIFCLKDWALLCLLLCVSPQIRTTSSSSSRIQDIRGGTCHHSVLIFNLLKHDAMA